MNKTEVEIKQEKIDNDIKAAMELFEKLSETLKQDETLIKKVLELNESLIAKNKNLESKLKKHIVHFVILYVIYFVLIFKIAIS